MSTTNGGPQPQMAMPQVGVLVQYMKDFSFENPHAPRSLAPSSAQPNINIQVNVEAAPTLPGPDQIDINLGQKLGVEQRAVLGAAGIVDRIARAEIVETIRHARVLAPRQQQRVDQPVAR
jgi:hypothetical protein